MFTLAHMDSLENDECVRSQIVIKGGGEVKVHAGVVAKLLMTDTISSLN